MNPRSVWIGLCALPLLSVGLALRTSQTSTSADREAMKKLDRWVGAWKGSGWASLGGDGRTEFELTERVQRRVGDSVFLIEGRGTTHNERGEELVTHDGLALVYYDSKTRRYHWHGHDVGWDAVDAEPTLTDGGLEWSFSPDGRDGVVRFTLEIDDERWHEVGDLSSDGKSWTRFMEMTLKRDE